MTSALSAPNEVMAEPSSKAAKLIEGTHARIGDLQISLFAGMVNAERGAYRLLYLTKR